MAAPTSQTVPPPGFQPEAVPVQAPPAVPDFVPEHKAFPVPAKENQARNMFAFADPIVRPIANVLSTIQQSRERLGLPNPGTVEHLTKEVKSTHLSNFFFDGARADLTKALSINPIFQVTHAFSYPGQGAPPSYNFGAVMGDDKVRGGSGGHASHVRIYSTDRLVFVSDSAPISLQTFLQGGIDDGGSVTMRANRGWFPGHTSKIQGQVSSPFRRHQLLPGHHEC